MPYGDGIPVFTNNINSPGLFNATNFILQQKAFQENAVTCMTSYPKKLLKKLFQLWI
jgi:hypothetical protein